VSHPAPRGHGGTHADLRVPSWRCPPRAGAAGWTHGGVFGRLSEVDRIFTLEEARLLLPDLLA
jgi:hypothetical protein